MNGHGKAKPRVEVHWYNEATPPTSPPAPKRKERAIDYLIQKGKISDPEEWSDKERPIPEYLQRLLALDTDDSSSEEDTGKKPTQPGPEPAGTSAEDRVAETSVKDGLTTIKRKQGDDKSEEDVLAKSVEPKRIEWQYGGKESTVFAIDVANPSAGLAVKSCEEENCERRAHPQFRWITTDKQQPIQSYDGLEEMTPPWKLAGLTRGGHVKDMTMWGRLMVDGVPEAGPGILYGLGFDYTATIHYRPTYTAAQKKAVEESGLPGPGFDLEGVADMMNVTTNPATAAGQLFIEDYLVAADYVLQIGGSMYRARLDPIGLSRIF